MALDCGYLPRERFDYFMEGYDEIQRMLSGMLARPERFFRAPGESNA